MKIILVPGFMQGEESWGTVAALLAEGGHDVVVAPVEVWAEESLSFYDACARLAALVEKTAADALSFDAPAADALSFDASVADASSFGKTASSTGSHKTTPVETTPLALVGYSLGGRLVAETLVRYPHLPLKAVLLESAGLGPQNPEEATQLQVRGQAWAARLEEEGLPAFVAWWETLPLFESQQNLPLKQFEAIRQARLVRSPRACTHELRTWHAGKQSQEVKTLVALESYAQKGTSITYVTGEFDTKYSAVAQRVKLHSLCSVIINKCGHNVHQENPEAFCRVLCEIVEH
jgi:2-succinyl-6-hydroxy-2,4-cyclohexadiene-1-carboxylate synthase